MGRFVSYTVQTLLGAALLTSISFLSLLLVARFPEFPQLRVSGPALLGQVYASKLLVAAVLVYAARRSRWAGTQLMCAIFVADFGINTFLPVSEAVFMLPDKITPATTALLTAHGFLVALLFAMGVVALTSRTAYAELLSESPRLHMAAWGWVWRLAVCLAARLALKVIGVAAMTALEWRVMFPAPLYGALGWAFLHTGQAVLLVVFALPMVKMLRGGRGEAAAAVAATFCLLGAVAPVILGHAFLPVELSWHDALESAVTQAAYGALVGYLFSYGEATPAQ